MKRKAVEKQTASVTGKFAEMGLNMGKGRERGKRQMNYELLRIIAMLMVITLHYLSHTEMLLMPGVEGGSKQILGMLLESFCIVAVNVYVLISGYFLVEAGFKIKRVLVLICQVLFYAVLIPLIMMGTGIFPGKGGDLYRLLQYIFPLETEHYWFAASYVLLYLFTPLLNTAVKTMNRKQLQIAIGGLLLLFCGIKSIVPVRFVTDRAGYDFGWFLCVYLVAAYIRLYGWKPVDNGKWGWRLYIICGLLSFSIGTGAYFINRGTGRFGYYTEVPYHYNYILCLLGAVGLFGAFRYVKIPEGFFAGLIGKLSPLTFGVYLFHEHIDIRNEWTGWIEDFIGPVAEAGVWGFILHLMVSVLAIFIAGCFVDGIRLYIFRYVGRHLEKSKPTDWVRRLDEEFR